jgi:hypothetical protein
MNFQAQNNQCIDPSDMDSWVDFGGLPSPTQKASSSRISASQASSAMTSPTNTLLPLDGSDDHQTPVAPSHDYNRFKQQTGLPSGSLSSLHALSQDQSMFNNYNTGLDEYGLSTSVFNGMGSQSGLDLGFEGDMTSPSLPAFFFPNDGSQNDDFIDPTAIQKQEEAQANIRYYPGMHQQAALKAQQQVQHQRQQAMLAHQQKQREAEQQRQNNSRRPSHVPVDPHAEETIARVVNQIRQSSNMSGDSMSPNPSSVLPHIIRNKKEEDEMDEDERLLNSEEGKKLSSKERRQLRNKVSARAFRSRRKEYIGQLEGELSVKTNEANELKLQNRALMEENARFRALSEKLLSHAAFRPFLDEISRDPELAQSLSKISGSSRQSATPTPQTHKDVDPYSAGSQQFMPQQNQHVGMVMMPEPQIDFSSLNLGGNSWGVPSAGMNNFQQHQVFAVLEVPEPAEPIDVAALSGKSEESDVETFASELSSKYDHPEEIETPELPKDAPAERTAIASIEVSEATTCQFDESDPAFTLFASTPSTSSAVPTVSEHPILLSEKPHFELVVSSDAEVQCSSDRLTKICSRMDASFRKLDALFAGFDM